MLKGKNYILKDENYTLIDGKRQGSANKNTNQAIRSEKLHTIRCDITPNTEKNYVLKGEYCMLKNESSSKKVRNKRVKGNVFGCDLVNDLEQPAKIEERGLTDTY